MPRRSGIITDVMELATDVRSGLVLYPLNGSSKCAHGCADKSLCGCLVHGAPIACLEHPLLKRAEAVSVYFAAQARGVQKLTLGGWCASLGDASASELVVPSGTSLVESDGFESVQIIMYP